MILGHTTERFGPDTLAPWLIDWGLDNRSAMVRVPPERGAAARLEVRLGDASANPYLAKLLGERFVTAYHAYKSSELERFSRYVTDWEFREYAYHL